MMRRPNALMRTTTEQDLRQLPIHAETKERGGVSEKPAATQ
jgi:hypothetical protein